MKTTFSVVTVALILSLITLPLAAEAALVNCGGYGESGSQSPCQLGDLVLTTLGLINFLLSWAWLVSVIFVLISGYKMIFAGGNEEAISSAKSSLTHAIVGFIIILISFVLINFVIGLMTGNPFAIDNLLSAFNLVPTTSY